MTCRFCVLLAMTTTTKQGALHLTTLSMSSSLIFTLTLFFEARSLTGIVAHWFPHSIWPVNLSHPLVSASCVFRWQASLLHAAFYACARLTLSSHVLYWLGHLPKSPTITFLTMVCFNDFTWDKLLSQFLWLFLWKIPWQEPLTEEKVYFIFKWAYCGLEAKVEGTQGSW